MLCCFCCYFPYRQPLDGASADLLIAQAKQLESGLREEFQRLVDVVNDKVNNKDNKDNKECKFLCLSSGLLAQAQFAPAKSAARVAAKCEEEAEQASSVLDFARLTVVFADPLLLAEFYDELKRREEEKNSEEKDLGEGSDKPQFKILRVINKFKQKRPMKQPPNVHINFLYEGHVCEEQPILEDFMLIKDYSHKPYELVRLAQDKKGKNTLPDLPQQQVDKLIEGVIAEGVFCKHPGAARYPLLSLSSSEIIRILSSSLS